MPPRKKKTRSTTGNWPTLADVVAHMNIAVDPGSAQETRIQNALDAVIAEVQREHPEWIATCPPGPFQGVIFWVVDMYQTGTNQNQGYPGFPDGGEIEMPTFSARWAEIQRLCRIRQGIAL